jgi:hypothetical protein
VARRRYRSEAISTAGHQERPPVGAAPEPSLEPRAEYGKAEPTPQPQAATESSQHFSSGLGQQLHDMRQQQQNDALEAYISHYFPGAWPNERAALRANQVWLANPGLVHAAGRIALERGVPRQSPEFLQAIGALIDQHHAAMMQAQPAPAPPMPPPMPAPPVTHIDLEKVEGPEGEPESTHMDAHFVSAPVSRASEAYSADYEPGEGSRVTLSKAEREHAEAAGVSVEEYGRQKLKMLRLKKSKVIKDE